MLLDYKLQDSMVKQIPYGWSFSIEPLSQRGYSRASFFSLLTRVLLGLFFSLIGLLFIVVPLQSWHRITYFQGNLLVGQSYKYYEPFGNILARFLIGIVFIILGIGILWIASYFWKEVCLYRWIEDMGNFST